MRREIAVILFAVLLFKSGPAFSDPQTGKRELVPQNPGAVIKESCSTEPRLRSVHSEAPTLIRFTNTYGMKVKIYWVDFDGKRQHYKDLDPNQSYDQPTYVTHPWVVTDAGPNQRCLEVVHPAKVPGVRIVN